jgi:hypothetical protein
MGAALTAYSDFLAPLGAKSTWSAHSRMEAERLYLETQHTGNALAAAMADAMPTHWSLRAYGFSIQRSGKILRYCDRHGKAQGGLQLTPTPAMIAYLAGFIMGAVAGSRTLPKTYKTRQDQTGQTGLLQFSLYDSVMRHHHEEAGYSARDARALCVAKGTLRAFAPHTASRATPDQAFAMGAHDSYHTITTGEQWSLGPTLWPLIYKHPLVVKLQGRPSAYRPYTPPWAGKMESWDAMASAIWHLLNAATPGKPTSFLLKTPYPIVVEAFCPQSAVAIALLDILTRETLYVPDLSSWTVFPLAQEQGQTARRLAAPVLASFVPTPS